MDLNDFSESKYLKKNDVPEHPGVVLQIDRFDAVEMEGEAGKKPVMFFVDINYKPMVLNATNRAKLENAFKSSDTTDMVGKYIGVYNDPEVMYAGKVVGGLRVRSLSRTEAQKFYGDKSENVASKGKPEGDDDIPF